MYEYHGITHLYFISDIYENVKNISFWRQERYLCSVLIDDTEKRCLYAFSYVW